MDYRLKSRERVDLKIIFILCSLVAFGLVMIFSVASSQGNLNLFYKQVICMSVGLAGLYIGQRAKVTTFRPFAIILYALSYVFIFMLLLPEPITVTVNGATRWLNFGFRFQVAEFVKIAVIFMLAYCVEYCQYRKSVKEEIAFIAIMWSIGFIPTILLLFISNDLSSSMVVAGITFIATFVASRGKMGWIFHVGAAIFVVLFVIFYVVHVSRNMPSESQLLSGEVSFRTGRVAAWLHPEAYSHSTGFQPLHCLYAIANGGWFGKGLGQSWQKAILPESENDVIFAIIIEELGIFGGIVLIFLFGVLIRQMIKVAYSTKDLFSRIIVVGVISHIMLQVMVHCGVCTNLLPNTGIGLPFISSGMTASLFQLAEMTLVLSVARVHIFDLYHVSSKRRIPVISAIVDRFRPDPPRRTRQQRDVGRYEERSRRENVERNGERSRRQNVGRNVERSQRQNVGSGMNDRTRRDYSARSSGNESVRQNSGVRPRGNERVRQEFGVGLRGNERIGRGSGSRTSGNERIGRGSGSRTSGNATRTSHGPGYPRR